MQRENYNECLVDTGSGSRVRARGQRAVGSGQWQARGGGGAGGRDLAGGWAREAGKQEIIMRGGGQPPPAGLLKKIEAADSDFSFDSALVAVQLPRRCSRLYSTYTARLLLHPSCRAHSSRQPHPPPPAPRMERTRSLAERFTAGGGNFDGHCPHEAKESPPWWSLDGCRLILRRRPSPSALHLLWPMLCSVRPPGLWIPSLHVQLSAQLQRPKPYHAIPMYRISQRARDGEGECGRT